MFRTIFFAVALGILAARFISNATIDDRKILGNIVLKILIVAWGILIIGLILWVLDSLSSVTIDVPDWVGWIFALLILGLLPFCGWLSNVKSKGWLKERWASRKESRKKMTKEEKKKKRKGNFLWCLKYIGIILGGAALIVWLVILILYLVSKS